jgi:uncharacterized membrane protein YjfL (UPF0719 family)
MYKKSVISKAIGYAFAASISASLLLLFIGMCLFGFQLTHWAEWQGRIAGVVATVAGIGGAMIGLQMALRPERRANH